MYEFEDLPQGLGMALAQNVHAMQNFAFLDKSARTMFIARAHGVQSRKEMDSLVQQLEAGKFN